MGEIGGDRVGGLLTHVIKRSGKKFTRTVVVGEETFVSSLEIRSDPYLSPNAGWWQSYLRGSPPVTVVRSGRPLRVVDAFCGSGGLSLGVRLAAAALGCTVDFVAAIDTDPSAMAVYTANLAPGVALTASAPTLVDFHVFGQGEKVEFGYRPELMNAPLSAVAPVDLFIAGPPCEGHSNLNNHTRREDPRNHLYLTAIALGVSLGARAILIENVPELKNDRRRVVQQAAALLCSAGYEVETEDFKADELGAPQRRRRFFLLAIKQPCAFRDVLRQVRSTLYAPATPISWAIGDLLDRDAVGLMDSTPAIAAINQDRVEYLFDNDLYDLPNDQRPVCHQNGTTYQAVYGRMHWDRPAHTITTGFGSPGQGRYVHSLKRRIITPHEAARIQTFPDSFSFTPEELRVSRKHLTKCIGDAVPPMLAYAPALGAIAAISGH